MFDSFIASMAGKYLGSRLDLQEDSNMNGTKKWYQSKTMWSDFATVALAIVGFVDKYKFNGVITASPWYSTALTFLGGVGLYGRATATDVITK